MALIFFGMRGGCYDMFRSTGAEYNQRAVRDATFSYQPNSQ
jgi:hypothetical protein